MQITSHHKRNSGKQRANKEWNAPAPGSYLLGAQEHPLQEEQHDERANLATN